MGGILWWIVVIFMYKDFLFCFICNMIFDIIEYCSKIWLYFKMNFMDYYFVMNIIIMNYRIIL